MKPIALTIGEPAGIGPDIVLQLSFQYPKLFAAEKIIIIGNKKLLMERAAFLKIPCDIDALTIVDFPLPEKCIPGKLNTRNANFVIDMLTYATQNCLEKKFSAIVTAPIHKGILNDAGFDFKGHTDFFSRYTQCETVMMLMNDSLKIALLTDHVPLKEVARLLTQEKLTRCLNIIFQTYLRRSQISDPRSLLICGLNPHAGENGYLGSEEKNIIIPVIEKFKKMGHNIIGPIGADVAFTEHYRAQADVILTMYHDQGLPVIKYAGFDDAINVTLGLPFVRASVDHGTALDIAGTGKANCNSLLKAIRFATQHVA